MKPVKLVCTSVLAALSINVHADVLYSGGPATGNTNRCAEDSGACSASWVVYDSFTLAAQSHVDSVSWTAVLFGGLGDYRGGRAWIYDNDPAYQGGTLLATIATQSNAPVHLERLRHLTDRPRHQPGSGDVLDRRTEFDLFVLRHRRLFELLRRLPDAAGLRQRYGDLSVHQRQRPGIPGQWRRNQGCQGRRARARDAGIDGRRAGRHGCEPPPQVRREVTRGTACPARPLHALPKT
jgi:hypothetical protein